MSRRLLRSLGLSLVAILLFAQMAIAAHACSGLPVAIGENPLGASADWGDEPPCSLPMAAAGDQSHQAPDLAGFVGPAMNHVCAGHCSFGQQSDQTPSVALPAVLLNARYGLPSPADPERLTRPAITRADKLAAASPPHAIVHCCFRL